MDHYRPTLAMKVVNLYNFDPALRVFRCGTHLNALLFPSAHQSVCTYTHAPLTVLARIPARATKTL